MNSNETNNKGANETSKIDEKIIKCIVCGVPTHLHGTACGWGNASIMIVANNDQELEWQRKWQAASPNTVLFPQFSDKIYHINCDPEALKDPAFVGAINKMAELAYEKGMIIKADQQRDIDVLKLGIEIVSAMKASCYGSTIEDGRIMALEDTSIDLLAEISPEEYDLQSEESKNFIKASVDREKKRLHEQAQFAATAVLNWFQDQGFTITKNP